MNQLRIAQELWFHAIVYYVGKPIPTVLKAVNISLSRLDDYIERAQYMEIDSTDKRVWIFCAVWWAGFAIKTGICKRKVAQQRVIAAIVL